MASGERSKVGLQCYILLNKPHNFSASSEHATVKALTQVLASSAVGI